MKNKPKFLLATLSLAGLVACGGGGGAPAPASTSLSGAVIDGYIEGATVCLDVNNNQTCDSGEPSATTAKDGSYKLDTSSLTTAQITAAHLLTVVPTTAKDADDGGKTLAEAGKKAFSLLAPASAYVNAAGDVTGAVISPLTTLVAHEMITGSNLATARANVITRLALPAGTDLSQDFVAKKDTALIEKAQMVAMTIAEVKAAALDDTSKPTGRDAFLAALTYLQTQVAELQAAFTTAKTEGTSVLKAVQDALKTDAAKPAPATLLAEAQKTSSSSAVSQVSSVLEAGIYGADHVLEDCGTNYSSCTPSYYKVQGSGGKLNVDMEYAYNAESKAWTKDSDESYSYRLTNNGWEKDSCANATYVDDGAGAVLVTCAAGAVDRVTARKVDAAGQTLSALGLNPPTGFGDIKMPAGAELYWLTFAAAADEYSLYVSENNKVGKWDFNQSPVSDLAALITRYTAVPTGHSGLRFKFNSGGTEAGGTVTLYSNTDYSGETATGTATYVIKTMGGKKVLVINKAAPGNSDGSYVAYGEKEGYVYHGSFRGAVTPTTPEPSFNKTMMNAILAAGKLPAVLD